MAIRSLISVLRRDVPTQAAVGHLLAEITTKSHPATRSLAQRYVFPPFVKCPASISHSSIKRNGETPCAGKDSVVLEHH